MDKQELNQLKDTFYNGETHAVYVDSDSVIIDGRDHTQCMYDYARELLTLLK